MRNLFLNENGCLTGILQGEKRKQAEPNSWVKVHYPGSKELGIDTCPNARPSLIFTVHAVDLDVALGTFLPWILPISWKYLFSSECSQRASLVPDMIFKVLGRNSQANFLEVRATLLSSWNNWAHETDADLEVPRCSERPNHAGVVERESHKLFPWDFHWPLQGASWNSRTWQDLRKDKELWGWKELDQRHFKIYWRSSLHFMHSYTVF